MNLLNLDNLCQFFGLLKAIELQVSHHSLQLLAEIAGNDDLHIIRS